MLLVTTELVMELGCDDILVVGLTLLRTVCVRGMARVTLYSNFFGVCPLFKKIADM